MTGDCYVLKSIRRSVEGKHLKCFQRWNFVFKFPLRTADKAYDILFVSDLYACFNLAEGRVAYFKGLDLKSGRFC